MWGHQDMCGDATPVIPVIQEEGAGGPPSWDQPQVKLAMRPYL
jgi:hypothetical protein